MYGFYPMTMMYGMYGMYQGNVLQNKINKYGYGNDFAVGPHNIKYGMGGFQYGQPEVTKIPASYWSNLAKTFYC